MSFQVRIAAVIDGEGETVADAVKQGAEMLKSILSDPDHEGIVVEVLEVDGSHANFGEASANLFLGTEWQYLPLSDQIVRYRP